MAELEQEKLQLVEVNNVLQQRIDETLASSETVAAEMQVNE